MRLQPSDDPRDRRPPKGAGASSPGPIENEDLAYKVELWDRQGETVEQVLAVTSSPSIGYAAYYAATQEFPDAVITLRHKNSIMSRWGGKPH
jgi:hypothetical protein